MHDTPSTLRPSGFCWVDLAASDATAAQRFYAAAFGWTFRDQPVPGGHFTRCQFEGRDVASLYPLRAAQRAQGVPSHWTPYLAVDTLDAALQRVAAHGGRQIVAPLDVPGIARIALVEDAVGALVGLWQPIRASPAARG